MMQPIGPILTCILTVLACLGLSGPTVHGELAERLLKPAMVAKVRPLAARELARIDLLIEQRQWKDAVRVIMDLVDGDGTGVIRIDNDRGISLRAWCHRLIAKLPPKALALYRERIDTSARRWYRQAIANRDHNQLQHLIDRALCSSWGDDGLLALGELALERGDYQQARNAWQCISRELWLVPGRAHGGLNYPDTDLNLAGVQARLALVSIRAGQFQRAELEIAQIGRRHPNPRGWLAGREGPYADRLRELLREARTTREDGRVAQALAERHSRVGADWPTFAGSIRRTNMASRGLGTHFRQLYSIGLQPQPMPAQGSESADPQSAASDHDHAGHPCGPYPIPVAIGARLFYGAGGQVHALDLTTGRPAWGDRSAIYTFQQPLPDSHAAVNPSQPGLAMHLSGSRTKLFVTAIAAQAASGQGPLDSSPHGPSRDGPRLPLVGFHLEQDGAIYFQRDPDASNWFYAGAPLVNQARILVAMIELDVRERLWIACFDIESGQLLWRKPVCESPWSSSVKQNHHDPILLTLDSGIVYCNSNRGVLAAMRARDGQLLWLHTYPRSLPAMTDEHASSCFPWMDRPGAGRAARPCLFHPGLLLVAPADSSNLLALDPANGLLVWSARRPTRDTRIVGVVTAEEEDRLVLAGRRLWGWRIDSGQPIAGWGDGSTGKEEVASLDNRNLPRYRTGLGVIAGDTVYWPTEARLLAIDGRSGRITESSLEWLRQGGAGLIATGRHLIVADRKQLTVFKATDPPFAESEDRVEFRLRQRLPVEQP